MVSDETEIRLSSAQLPDRRQMLLSIASFRIPDTVFWYFCTLNVTIPSQKFSETTKYPPLIVTFREYT